MDDVRVRDATPTDASALDALRAAAPDGGAVRFRPEQHVAGEAAAGGSHEHSVTVVAANSAGELVGSARVDLGTCWFAGQETRYALLNSLMVAPHARRQGIGAALARARLARAGELAGADVLAVAYIQAGNQASLANARRWAPSVGGRLVVTPVPMRRRPPRPSRDLVVRPATDGELDEVADRVTTATRAHDLAPLVDAGRLRAWLARSPFADPIHHYWVVTDRRGRLLAGFALREEGRVQSLVIDRMPVALRAANAVLRVVPSDGRMRNLIVDRVWVAPEAVAAARHLWEVVRWEWRDRATSMVATHDPRSVVHQVVHAPPWLPTTSATVALRYGQATIGERVLEQL